MVFFERFRKKEIEKLNIIKHHIFNSFSSLRNDLTLQNRWIDYLYKMHLSIKDSHDTHKKSVKADIDHVKSHIGHVKSHVGDIKTNMNDMSKLIEHIHNSTKLQEQRLAVIEKGIKEAFTLYNEHIRTIYKLVNSAHNTAKEAHTKINDVHKKVTAPVTIDKDLLKKELLEEINKSVSSSALTFKPEVVYKNAPLTNPEQKLLTMLFNEPEPLSYDKLAAKTGHSVNTIRVNMNILKKRGLIEENILPSGVKLFNLNNREKIKKIYNIQVL